MASMHGAVRSQLRRLLIIWAAAWLALIIGYCAALAVFFYGLFRIITIFTSDNLTLASLVPMVIGVGLQLVLVVLIVGVRDRFEGHCWELIRVEADISTGGGSAHHMLGGQADGRGDQLTAAHARRTQRFSKRLAVLIEQAWPHHPS